MNKLTLSYAAPLKAFDRITELNEAGITVQKDIKSSEPFFAGHYPNFPIYPGVFIVETVQQAARHYAVTYGNQVKLVEVKSSRFLKPVLPGDSLESKCQCLVQNENELHVNATCFSNEVKVAEVKLIFRFENYAY